MKIMGIVNVTPDSFSDGGELPNLEAIIARSQALTTAGADILDIGGEATGPGSRAITAEEEWQRISPVVNALSERHFLSVDTYKSSTAASALEAGAKMINDVSALRADPSMAAVVKNANCPVVMMYSKEEATSPHASDKNVSYRNVIQEISEFLLRRVEYALQEGISEQQIILDPGMGRFVSNDPAVSWEILRRFDELVERLRPFPVLVGTSRKGFLGGTLKARDPLSQLTAVACVEKGASFIRTHNVEMATQFFAAWKRMKGLQ